MVNKELTTKYGDFMIKKPCFIGGTPKDRELDWDICQYADNHKYNWTIATLRWNSKEPCYYLQSIGMRLAEVGSRKLLRWIMQFSEEAERENLKESEE